MKQFIFVVVIFFGARESFSQVEIGLQLSPTISSNRIETQADLYTVKSDGGKLKFKFGLIADFGLSDNYYFSTGLLYTPKQVSLRATENPAVRTLTEEYNLQYLQIPLTMKLYTNEITLDTKLFFQLGATAEVAISEKFEIDNEVIEDFKLFDTSLLLGAGVERKIGANTAIYVAVVYNRGLINPIADGLDIGEKIVLNNDLISLDLGIKF
jgi:hypothetical protein